MASYADAVASDTKLFSRYFTGLLNAGVYLAPSQFEAMFVSSAHGEDELNSTAEKIKDVLSAIFG